MFDHTNAIPRQTTRLQLLQERSQQRPLFQRLKWSYRRTMNNHVEKSLFNGSEIYQDVKPLDACQLASS